MMLSQPRSLRFQIHMTRFDMDSLIFDFQIVFYFQLYRCTYCPSRPSLLRLHVFIKRSGRFYRGVKRAVFSLFGDYHSLIDREPS